MTIKEFCEGCESCQKQGHKCICLEICEPCENVTFCPVKMGHY